MPIQSPAGILRTTFLSRKPSYQGWRGEDGIVLDEKGRLYRSKKKENRRQMGVGAGEEGADNLAISVKQDDYLPAEMLTQRAQIQGDVEPTLPGSDLSSVEGRAELLVLVSSDGHADSVLVVESSLPSKITDYAVKQFQAAIYQPGKINNTYVRSRINIGLSIAN